MQNHINLGFSIVPDDGQALLVASTYACLVMTK